ncbi:enoyl-CoA hydratase/isomerase family protein [Rhodobacter sp. NTK016B]|uniref:enoyl-CoA hydratase/isomerase family protein n=1 Tax=Rhodobacter sp. NTK016B TaxID=2759676 RepID=UPI001A8C1F65|nr:enoyl-CoA hydratase/isomerase family protein [Rhodobacter sp. NTK016B]MBN8292456.1 enoyl-CoA hydratase/isomerase family protein [Rhodobacter sp. NTK016B]
MTYQLIEVTSAGGITTIALNRTDKRNAMSIQMFEELGDAFRRFDAGDDRAAVLCSNDPKIFCAGADLHAPPELAWQALPGVGVSTDKPIIAAVNKRVIGIGVVLVALCDFVVVSEESVLDYPEARLGFSGSLITALVKRMPLRVAMEMIMLGEPVGGKRAYDLGFANRLVEPGQERAEAMAMAERLAANAPLVVTGSKRMCLEAAGRTPMEIQYSMMAQADQMMNSEDAKRGMEAWARRETPVFKGR